jgi:hypothetical protein
MKANWMACWLAAAAVLAPAATTLAEAAEQRWTLRLEGIFHEGRKPLYLYARERGGEWIAVVGSSRDPDRMGGKTYNRSWYYGDLSEVPIRDGRMQGRFTLHVTPDLWVPLDHKGYTIDFEVDAKVTDDDTLDGSFRIVDIASRDATVRDLGRSGRFHGAAEPEVQPEMPDDVTLVCNMQGALVGGKPQYGNRCMVLWLGIEDGELTATSHGLLSKKLRAYGRTAFHAEGNTAEATRDRIRAHVTVPTNTLNMEPCRYVFDIDGRPLEGLLVGTYELTVHIEGRPDVHVRGAFDGSWHEGVQPAPERDDRPWFRTVRGFEPVEPGEHPRLLFREDDLPALREKADTPEGRAILKRLRHLLDGDNGETMTTKFSDATHAYMGGGWKSKKLDEPGVYTIGHVAGYGLLYQLTGEKKYAEFGRQCFEKALAGVRDRDDRYSFRNPGGDLRAGPSVGWYAVGYDLCYDGWDAATREKLGRAIAEYSVASGAAEDEDPYVAKYANKQVDLESLARGTMPPSSNHFGLQVGGASLALLAVSGEEFVDQQRIDTLLAVARDSMIRNMFQGFGDGGFFTEGDGTGSMSSQLSFLAGLQAWRNARGVDFVNVERPNARMMTLKWIYLTVVRDGRPHFWPIRGSYGHNVWAREGLSGAGYFAYGFGGVPDEHKAAMKWYYDRFLLEHDRQRGAPYDTVSRYPQAAVCAFVNWPVEMKPRDPDEVLPHCYRDSIHGFYAWRNRWQDGNDTVISLLTQRTSGYMYSRPDKVFRILSGGRRINWGTVQPGPTTYWHRTPQGETSVLTLADGTSYAVDFTGASGADTMLVTTGKAKGQTVKVAGRKLTFFFPTAESPPQVRVKGDAAVVGKQRVTVDDGNLSLAVSGK